MNGYQSLKLVKLFIKHTNNKEQDAVIKTVIPAQKCFVPKYETSIDIVAPMFLQLE